MKSNIPVAEIEKLIGENRGNISVVARRLGVSRGTIYNRIGESATLQRALEDARETMLDMAESILYKKALEGSTPELIFFLKTQGKSRGYTERQEVTGADGGEILIKLDR